MTDTLSDRIACAIMDLVEHDRGLVRSRIAEVVERAFTGYLILDARPEPVDWRGKVVDLNKAAEQDFIAPIVDRVAAILDERVDRIERAERIEAAERSAATSAPQTEAGTIFVDRGKRLTITFAPK